MNPVIVREATFDDLDTLLRFEQGVIAAERPFDCTLKTEDCRYYDLPAMLRSPQVRLVVAIMENEIVGCGYARIEPAKEYNKHSQHAYLGFMYVPAEHRGKGINGKIMQALKAWSRSQGVTELRLEVYQGNEPAVRAYEKAGFEKLLITMRMEIKEE